MSSPGGPTGPGDASARIAVLIPTFNRRDVVLRCLAALAAQTGLLPGAMELVVVDDGSADGTTEAVRQAAGAMALPLRCVRQENAGANVARNLAMTLTDAPLLLFLNDDSIAAPGLVAEHLRQHALHPAAADAVLGALLPTSDPPPGLFEALHHDPRFDGLA